MQFLSVILLLSPFQKHDFGFWIRLQAPCTRLEPWMPTQIKRDFFFQNNRGARLARAESKAEVVVSKRALFSRFYLMFTHFLRQALNANVLR